MISKEEIKSIVFGNYSKYLKSAKEKGANVRRFGVQADELVNEAIIAIIDCKIKFETAEAIDKFILKAIDGVAYSEYIESKKQTNERSGDGEEYLLSDVVGEAFEYGDSIYAAKSEELYDVIFNFRFPTGLECPNCGCKNPHGHSFGYQCRICRTAYSIKTRTYLHHDRTPLKDIYRCCEFAIKKKAVTGSYLKQSLGLKESPIKVAQVINKIISANDGINVIGLLKHLLQPVAFIEGKIHRKVSGGWASSSEKNEIIKGYLEGKNQRQLTEIHARGSKIVKKIIEESGLKRRNQNESLTTSINVLYKMGDIRRLFNSIDYLEDRIKYLMPNK